MYVIITKSRTMVYLRKKYTIFADTKNSKIIPVNNSEKPLWYDELLKAVFE